MENLREDFIIDNQPGDYLTIMLQNGTEWTGTLLDWNERRLRLEVSGAPRSVSFSMISGYYPATREAEKRQAVAPAPMAPVFSAAPAPAPQPKLTAAQQAVKRVETACYRTAFDPDLVRERIRLAPNTIEKERINALFQNFQRAYEQSANPDPLELRRIMAAADKISTQYPDSPLTQGVIGEMALRVENWDLAEDSLYLAQCYARAFFAASKLENSDKLAEDGACHLLYEKKIEPDVAYTFVRLAAEADDLSVFRRFMEIDEKRNAQITADCLCWLLNRAGSPMPDGDGIAEDTVIDAMRELFDRFYPDPDNSQLAALERGDDEPEPPQPAPVQPAAAITGYIFDYSPFRKIGRIHSEERPDWFFHLNHIADASLAEMLNLEPGHRYQVIFDKGHNSSGVCAVNIRLANPQKPWNDFPSAHTRLSGTITRFFPSYMNGQITSDGDVYNFRVDEIDDIELRSYCEVFNDPAERRIEVTFSLRQLRDGKLVAVSIQKAQPFTREEQQAIWERVDQERHRTGCITRYYPTQRRGIISDNGTDFFFDLRNVADHLLRAYCEQRNDVAERQFNVNFAAVHRAGRCFAENIQKAEPFSEEEQNMLMRYASPSFYRPMGTPFENPATETSAAPEIDGQA